MLAAGFHLICKRQHILDQPRADKLFRRSAGFLAMGFCLVDQLANRSDDLQLGRDDGVI